MYFSFLCTSRMNICVHEILYVYTTNICLCIFLRCRNSIFAGKKKRAPAAACSFRRFPPLLVALTGHTTVKVLCSSYSHPSFLLVPDSGHQPEQRIFLFGTAARGLGAARSKSCQVSRIRPKHGHVPAPFPVVLAASVESDSTV